MGTLIVEGKVTVELESVENVHPTHKKQVRTYLRPTGMKLGYLPNFGEAFMKDGSVAPWLCENQERANKTAPLSADLLRERILVPTLAILNPAPQTATSVPVVSVLLVSSRVR